MVSNSIMDNKKYLIKKSKFSSRFALALLLSMFILIILGERTFVLVKSGQLGVVWNFFSGTEKKHILTEGLNVVSPLNEVFLYDVRIQSIDKSYILQTKEGLNLTAGVNIMVRPDYRTLPELHQSIGQNYIEKIVVPAVEGIVRQIFGRYTAEEIYSGSHGIADNLVVSAFEAIQSKHIIVDRVIVKSISMPDVLKNSIENKVSLDQEAQSYRFKLDIAGQEAKRQVIEAHGVNDSQKIIGQSLSAELLRWHGIIASKDLSKSQNAKTVIYGAGRDGLPLIMNDKQ